MFIKLLATNIVASNFLGRSSKRDIILKAVGFSSKPLSKSDRVSEKNAISEPDISAEHNNSIISKIIPGIIEKPMVIKGNIKLEGSGSNVIRFG